MSISPRYALGPLVIGLLVVGGSTVASADDGEPGATGSITVELASESSPSLAVSLHCVLDEEDITVADIVSDGGSVTFDDLPAGAECAPAAEPTVSAEEEVGVGFRWSVPLWTGIESDDPTSATVVGGAESRLSVDVAALGQFQITAADGTERDVLFTCDAPAYSADGRVIANEDSSANLTVGAAGVVSSDWYRVGTVCALTDEGSGDEEIVTIAGATSPVAVAFQASEAGASPGTDPALAPAAPRPLATSSGFVVVDQTAGSDSGYTGPITYEYTCTGVTGAPSGSVDLAPGTRSEVIDAPIGSRCQSRAAVYPPAPGGWRIVDLSWGASHIRGGAEPAELRNRLLLVSTTLTVPVALTPRLIDPGSGFDGRIQMSWECWGGASGIAIARLNEPSAPVDMPVGDICGVTSTDLVDPAPPGWELALERAVDLTGMPTVIPLSAVGSILSVDMTDEMVPIPTDLVVEVVVVNPDGVTHEVPFTGTWTCDFFGTITEGTWKIDASGGRVFREVMPYSDCSITQDPLVDPLRAEWSDSTVEVVPNPRANGVPTFVVTNTLRATGAPAGTGSLAATGGDFDARLWLLGGAVTLALGAALIGGAARRARRG